jgi:hypothetical protein
MKGAGRWLDDAADPGSRALRQALDDARSSSDDVTFARQRVWPRVQAPWWDGSGKIVGPRDGRGGGWLAPLLAGAGVATVVAVAVLVSAGLLRAPEAPLAVGPAARPAALPDVVPLPPPAIALTTGLNERMRRRLARGVEVELSPRTALMPGDVRVAPEVKVGRVRFSVPHQPPGQRYSVHAGPYRVVVLGTVFDVAIEEAGVSVEVESGTVEVREAASERLLQRLPAGARWSSGRPDVLDRPRSQPVRSMVRPARKAPPRKLGLARPPPEPRPDDPRRALARYQTLVDGGGPMADVSLYRIGEIEQHELRDLRRAAATWRRYGERYPQGLLRAEADLWLIEALIGLDEQGGALEAAQAFLQRHRDSERRAEVARVAGDLARLAGDCPSALGFYDLALESRPGREDEDDALFYRADCLGQLGDGRATPTLRAYLGRFPLGRHAVQAQQELRGAGDEPGGP